jgi:hypothetical protein
MALHPRLQAVLAVPISWLYHGLSAFEAFSTPRRWYLTRILLPLVCLIIAFRLLRASDPTPALAWR